MDKVNPSDKVCTRCVLPASYPGLTFNDQGVCSFCLEYEKWCDYWKLGIDERRENLNKIVEEAKNKHKEFDALIPLSGGKDSTYVLYIAKKELGLNCLAYTADNGFLSKHARVNIDKACQKLGVEHFYYRFNPQLMKKLYRLFVQKTGYPCTVCMRMMGVGIAKIADLYKIPLVITGSSPRTELMGTKEMSEHGSIAHFRGVLKNEPILKECNRALDDYCLRRKIGHVLFKLTGRKHLFTYAWFNLAEYVEWNYENILKTIRQELEWQSPQETEHMDCLIHPIQNYIQLRRFPDLSIERMTYARLIMAGQMTRQEALERLKSSKIEGLEQALELLFTEIEMEKDEFDEYIDLGPRHMKYYSPTLTERLILKLFKFRT